MMEPPLDGKQLPIVAARGGQRLGEWRWHAVRVALVAGTLWLVRDAEVRRIDRRAIDDAAKISMERVRDFFPRGAAIASPPSPGDPAPVQDASGETIGYLLQTSPASDRIVGYSGPTNAAVALDPQRKVVGIEILESGDTAEHVARVRQSHRFLHALDGRSLGDLTRPDRVDAVSGATLTSLAILEGIRARVGGGGISLRFPRRPDIDELRTFFPRAARLHRRRSPPRWIDVLDRRGRRIGAALTSSPAADNLIGYQGPTDTMVLFGPDLRVRDVVVRSSYDNEPYVRYIREEPYFGQRLRGKTLADLSRFDPDEAEIEGVSGATMTSRAIALGLPMAATDALSARDQRRSWVPIVSFRDLGTVAVLALALSIAFARRPPRHRWRHAYRWLLVVYLGFLNGDLLSQSLLVGWAQHGVPWRVAPGLVLLASAALVVPIVARRNIYCQHVCPFGAAQQLLLRKRRRRRLLGRRGRGLLKMIPPALLLLVLFAALRPWPLDVAGLEPFDAFTPSVAGWSAIGIAVVGLLASRSVPLAYCRFGCPTGAVLGYVRRGPHRARFTRQDRIALLLFVAALLLYGACSPASGSGLIPDSQARPATPRRIGDALHKTRNRCVEAPPRAALLSPLSALRSGLSPPPLTRRRAAVRTIGRWPEDGRPAAAGR